jgi:hypothetical protein
MPKSRDVTLQRSAELDQCENGQIVLPALNPTNIAAVKGSHMGKFLLRHAECPSPLADTLSKDVEIRITHPARSWER